MAVVYCQPAWSGRRRHETPLLYQLLTLWKFQGAVYCLLVEYSWLYSIGGDILYEHVAVGLAPAMDWRPVRRMGHRSSLGGWGMLNEGCWMLRLLGQFASSSLISSSNRTGIVAGSCSIAIYNVRELGDVCLMKLARVVYDGMSWRRHVRKKKKNKKK